MKKILFMINSMGVGGAEKSLSSLLNLFDYQRYDVYLQMINRGGTFEKLLPPQVKILPSIPYFQFCGLPLVKQLTAGNIRFLKARLAVSEQLRKNDRAGKPLHATQVLWNGARNAFDPLPGAYDVAIAWGQGTPTHFVAEKVNAAKKIAWVNADYEGVGFNRGFDREIYGRYDYISCVSGQLSEKFREVFPEYAEKVVTVYDINSEKLIKSMAEEPADLPSLHGTVITTVGRLVTQKGYDIAIEAARILKEFPQKIKSLEQRIEGYQTDIDQRKRNTEPNEDGFSPMIMPGGTVREKKAAGDAILGLCKSMTSPDPIPIGQYRGFDMELSFDTFSREYKITLIHQLRHTVTLGTDIFGNIQRLDNTLGAFEERMAACVEQLENTRVQLENAKAEVQKPFPQEEELKTKSARLNELNAMLNLDKRENEIVDGERGEEEPRKSSADRER